MSRRIVGTGNRAWTWPARLPLLVPSFGRLAAGCSDFNPLNLPAVAPRRHDPPPWSADILVGVAQIDHLADRNVGAPGWWFRRAITLAPPVPTPSRMPSGRPGRAVGGPKVAQRTFFDVLGPPGPGDGDSGSFPGDSGKFPESPGPGQDVRRNFQNTLDFLQKALENFQSLPAPPRGFVGISRVSWNGSRVSWPEPGSS